VSVAPGASMALVPSAPAWSTVPLPHGETKQRGVATSKPQSRLKSEPNSDDGATGLWAAAKGQHVVVVVVNGS
jgi:hypothetical protein